MKHPERIHTTGRGGRIYHFHMAAPITGDGIYKAADDKGNEFHALVPNPDAHDHQARMLLRRS